MRLLLLSVVALHAARRQGASCVHRSWGLDNGGGTGLKGPADSLCQPTEIPRILVGGGVEPPAETCVEIPWIL